MSRFFPGARDVLAAIDDEVVLEVAGPTRPGAAVCFEDQYASSGGCQVDAGSKMVHSSRAIVRSRT